MCNWVLCIDDSDHRLPKVHTATVPGLYTLSMCTKRYQQAGRARMHADRAVVRLAVRACSVSCRYRLNALNPPIKAR